jgi:hypothetical protein
MLRRVEEGALYTYQEGAAGLVFQGRIRGALVCLDIEGLKPPVEAVALLAALRLLDCLGGKKTIGLGSCRITVQRLCIGDQVLDEDQDLDQAFRETLEWLEMYDDYRRA